MPRSYAVLGCGAIGAFYGARLARAGHDVHFILRSDHAHVQRHGLVIESVDGDFRLPQVAAYADAKELSEARGGRACDVVLIGLKTTANAVLAHALPPLVGPGTSVLVLQNGLGVEAQVARWAPQAHVVGGMCFICAQRVGPGHVRHLDQGPITAAAHRADGAPAGVTPELEQLARDFALAGIALLPEADLGTARWKKLVWNVPFNGLSVVLHASTRELTAQPEARALVESLMHEVIDAATACGHAIDRSFIDTMLCTTDAMPPYLPSMRLDADAGRPLELDAIYAAPLAAAKRAGLPTPRIEMLYRQLRAVEARSGMK